MYIIAAIITFGILIIIHELGHFTLAKLNGIKVEEFAIGMGPQIFKINRKETVYSIRILPIGGYVKMLGDEGESTDPRAFNNKSPLRKLSVVLAGPVMNFILGIVLFAIIAAGKGYLSPIVDKVVPNQPAAVMGLKSGDKIVKVNGSKILTWEDFVTGVYTSAGKTMDITYVRNGETKSVKVTPVKDPKENRFIVGVYPTAVEKPTMGQSISYGFTETNSLVKQTFSFLKSAFKGKVSKNDFGGPVTIIKLSGAAAKAGILALTAFGAYITVQLGIFNLLPIPALDGGYIFLFLFELITGKKVDQNKVGVINYVGFALLMGLMVLVTIKDILYPIKF
ncbi:zinc metalloprotease [Clostridium carboxidivorans P7]|uniref:Zinc metalloprotease n=1 Tax=Clostridium carboxidivorans P7 TaxID=536227 RepID=C6PQX6_9CLOT|nr:RIP metalloprotease RseP [Clostridium carboxidivorans]AKN29465.1 zinc metalloprotease [Clostridium carboxidivorans P7]EET88340.1 membrane-associated zinc metalloprotease [Clostridium carboxidivorans P7]